MKIAKINKKIANTCAVNFKSDLSELALKFSSTVINFTVQCIVNFKLCCNEYVPEFEQLLNSLNRNTYTRTYRESYSILF